jgi:hypothetical protein
MRGRTRVRGIRLAVIERFCSLCLLASGVIIGRISKTSTRLLVEPESGRLFGDGSRPCAHLPANQKLYSNAHKFFESTTRKATILQYRYRAIHNAIL